MICTHDPLLSCIVSQILSQEDFEAIRVQQAMNQVDPTKGKKKRQMDHATGEIQRFYSCTMVLFVV